jgi:methylation protein EvaC
VITKLFSLGIQPMANKYPNGDDQKIKEIKSEMNVYYCEPCAYINIPCDVDRSIFFQDYYYLSSVNAELTKHFKVLASEIERDGYNFVVDVGSNDGVLLRELKERGISCLGIDPSENVAQIANAEGLTTMVGFFDDEIVDSVIKEYGQVDLITASSVFTHLNNPIEFFRNARKLLSANGKIIIEVEYLPSIIEDFAFERFYFDRPHYYSLKSIIKMAAIHNFFVEDAEIVNVHGGSLKVTISNKKPTKAGARVSSLLGKESNAIAYSNIINKFHDFQNACSELKIAIQNFKSEGLRVAGYGCPARFSTITNFANLTVDELEYVVDDSQLKQNRFSPGIHIPIRPYSYTDSIDVFIVFAFEYINSIKEKIGERKHKFFRPVPFGEI